MKSSLRVLLVLSMLQGTTSCIKVDTGTTGPTIGSELIDLSKAKKMGELSDKEFAELRRKVLASF